MCKHRWNTHTCTQLTNAGSAVLDSLRLQSDSGSIITSAGQQTLVYCVSCFFNGLMLQMCVLHNAVFLLTSET